MQTRNCVRDGDVIALTSWLINSKADGFFTREIELTTSFTKSGFSKESHPLCKIPDLHTLFQMSAYGHVVRPCVRVRACDSQQIKRDRASKVSSCVPRPHGYYSSTVLYLLFIPLLFQLYPTLLQWLWSGFFLVFHSDWSFSHRLIRNFKAVRFNCHFLKFQFWSNSKH